MGSTYGGAGTIWEAEHEQIRATCSSVPLVDAHAHNVVPLDSNLPFLQCLSDERGHEALSAVPLSLAYQVGHRPPIHAPRLLRKKELRLAQGAPRVAKFTVPQVDWPR